jgi:hypothetical protein
VGGGRCLARGPGGSFRRQLRAGSGCGVGGNRCGARRSAPHFSPHPATRRVDGPARPVIRRAFSLEVRKNMLGTPGSPQGK